MEQGWVGKATAEFVATFGLIFFGAGSIVVNAHLGAEGYGLLGIAFAHAIVLAILVSATMNISGGHVNPAVTIAALLTRKISPALSGVYILSQLLGAIVGAAFIKALLPLAAGEATAFGTPVVAAGIDGLKAVTIELVLTFFLVFTIWGTAVSRHAPTGIAGFGIGLVLLFDILVGGPFTGASMNPARTLGPALIAGEWGFHWVYWVGPILGAALAAAVYEGVVEKGHELPPEVEPHVQEQDVP